MGSKPELIAIVGPTAGGKSELAMRVAKEFNGEIISVDSRMVYKGMNIGTGKPSIKDQQAIRHHLLDVVQVDQPFTAADFKKAANAVISDIQKRNKLPILTGGSGLYADSVLFDFEFLSAGNPKDRDRLNKLTIEQLHQELENKQITPPLNYQNKRHLIRTIETAGHKAGKKQFRPKTLVIGIDRPTEELKGLIARRNAQMINGGLEGEVKGLINKFSWQAKSLDAIGYREWQGYFDGSLSMQQVRELITKNSISYAKRQRTWFKRNKFIHWYPSPEVAYKHIAKALNKEVA